MMDSKIAATTNDFFGAGHLFVSNDGGATWNENSPETMNFRSVLYSPDGSTLITTGRPFMGVDAATARAYLSVDDGTTWQYVTPPGFYFGGW
jgi:hypothetical protein